MRLFDVALVLVRFTDTDLYLKVSATVHKWFTSSALGNNCPPLEAFFQVTAPRWSPTHQAEWLGGKTHFVLPPPSEFLSQLQYSA